MAEFCTKCSGDLFGENAKGDIQVQQIFESLEDGHIQSGFICEGCGMVGIAKLGGQLLVCRTVYSEDGEEQYSETFENLGDYLR